MSQEIPRKARAGRLLRYFGKIIHSQPMIRDYFREFVDLVRRFRQNLARD